jgi:hypothetical protein
VVDGEDNILVCGYSSKCVKVFRKSGELMRTIGEGVLTGPVGICIDFEGRVIVGDQGPHKVLLF